MSSTPTRSEPATQIPGAGRVDMKLEVVVLPVSDVDRAKRFYGNLGWRLDADVATGEDFRVVQLTPPGSQCSVIFQYRSGGNVDRIIIDVDASFPRPTLATTVTILQNGVPALPDTTQGWITASAQRGALIRRGRPETPASASGTAAVRCRPADWPRRLSRPRRTA
jgi:hypothetical protein